MKRIEVDDPVAMCQMGKYRYDEGNHKIDLNILQRQLNWVTWERISIIRYV